MLGAHASWLVLSCRGSNIQNIWILIPNKLLQFSYMCQNRADRMAQIDTNQTVRLLLHCLLRLSGGILRIIALLLRSFTAAI